jgi:hypothetical protein
VGTAGGYRSAVPRAAGCRLSRRSRVSRPVVRSQANPLETAECSLARGGEQQGRSRVRVNTMHGTRPEAGRWRAAGSTTTGWVSPLLICFPRCRAIRGPCSLQRERAVDPANPIREIACFIEEQESRAVLLLRSGVCRRGLETLPLREAEAPAIRGGGQLGELRFDLGRPLNARSFHRVARRPR